VVKSKLEPKVFAALPGTARLVSLRLGIKAAPVLSRLEKEGRVTVTHTTMGVAIYAAR
jgi:hypothetical protein